MKNFLVYKIAHSGTYSDVIHESDGVSGVQRLCILLYAVHEILEVEGRKCLPGVVAAHSTYFFCVVQALSLTVQDIYVFGGNKQLTSPRRRMVILSRLSKDKHQSRA